MPQAYHPRNRRCQLCAGNKSVLYVVSPCGNGEGCTGIPRQVRARIRRDLDRLGVVEGGDRWREGWLHDHGRFLCGDCRQARLNFEGGASM